MGYGLRVNRCKGTFVGVYSLNGRQTESSEFSSQADAVEAIHHHHRTGFWPREVEERAVEICSACGQVVQGQQGA